MNINNPSGTLLDTALGIGKKGATAVAAAALNQTLTGTTAATRVNPRVLVEESLRGQPYLTDVLHVACSIFSAYYLTAASVLNVINGVSVVERLDRLNPNRDPISSAVSRVMNKDELARGNVVISMAGYGDGQIVPEDFSLGLPGVNKHELSVEMVYDAETNRYIKREAYELAMEARNEEQPKEGEEGDEKKKDEKPGDRKDQSVDSPFRQPVSHRNAIVTINDNNNLGVGKILEVTLGNGKDVMVIPVTVTLAVTTTDSISFGHILSLWRRDYSIKERWHGLRSGELTFWRDIVLMQDIIEKNRKALMRDKSNYLRGMFEASRKNMAAAAITGHPSVATASSIFMFTSDTARQCELETGLKFDNPTDRQRIFEATYSMLMFIIDPEWETVTIYHRDIAASTKLHLRELKNANKGGGPDIAEILKAYQMGRQPSIY